MSDEAYIKIAELIDMNPQGAPKSGGEFSPSFKPATGMPSCDAMPDKLDWLRRVCGKNDELDV